MSLLSMISAQNSTPSDHRRASNAESSIESCKIELEAEEERMIILLDMDAYYAQVEMKKHGIPQS